jgi:hypothetical protein
MKTINYHLLTQDSFYTFSVSYLNAIIDSNIDDAVITRLRNSLKDTLNELEGSMYKATTSSITKTVSANDSSFNNSFRSLKYILKGYSLSKNRDKREAANDLISIIERHGWDMHNEAYSIQNSKASNLIRDFDVPEAIQNIAALSVEDLVEDIKKDINNLEVSIKERDSYITGNDGRKSDEIMKDIKKIIKQINTYITSKVTVEEDAEWNPIMMSINQIIDREMLAARKRRN